MVSGLLAFSFMQKPEPLRFYIHDVVELLLGEVDSR
jgi:hypothetical protein